MKMHLFIKFWNSIQVRFLIRSALSLVFLFAHFCLTEIIAGNDTLIINQINQEALNSARKTPDNAIHLGYKAYSLALKADFPKGMADASLVLGTAWLALFNRHDSAFYYNSNAYEQYLSLKDEYGMARAAYNLSYVNSLKGDLELSEKFGQLSLTHFENSGNMLGLINSYSVLSYLSKQKKDFMASRQFIQSAIKISREIRDTIALADAINNLGNIYKDLALFQLAIDSYFEALQLWEMKGNDAGISIAYGSIGLMYYYQEDYEKALEFSRKKLPLISEAGNKWELSKTHGMISQIFISMGLYDSAMKYQRNALKMNEEMNYNLGKAGSFHKLAIIYSQLSEINSAELHINKAITIGEEIQDPELVNYYLTRGDISFIGGSYSDALNYAERAYQLAKKDHQLLVLADVTLTLSRIYEKLGQYKKAYNFLGEHKLYKDSIVGDDFQKQITRYEIEYEYEKLRREAEYLQEQELMQRENRLEQQSLLIRVLIVLILLIALIFWLIIRHNRTNALLNKIEMEQKLLRSQLNPHFIFNSLCAVQDFIIHDQPDIANEFLTKIAQLMRYVLENSGKDFIPLEEEIGVLSLYCEIQQLRFETNFEFQILIQDEMDTESISVPPMLAQPCVENAIEHGLLPKKGKGELLISYSIEDGLVLLQVKDNGVGRNRSAQKKKNGLKNKDSVSSRLTSMRLEHFKKTLRNNGIGWQIIDLHENGNPVGTSVVMKLPFKGIF